jgi:hypothetical protein
MNYTGRSKLFHRRWIITSDSPFPISVSVYSLNGTWYFPGGVALAQKSYDTKREAISFCIDATLINLKALKDELCKL